MKRITSTILSYASLLALVGALLTLSACDERAEAKPAPVKPQVTQAQKVARGQYLVMVGGCNDCHTPLKMGPKGPEPDLSRMLSGHPEYVKMPPPPKTEGPWVWSGAGTNTAFAGPWGVSYARNLTPDQVSGLGIWDEAMFIKTLRTGRHMGVSRPILPPMPWFNYGKMKQEDLQAVYAYLRSIPPVRNEVPDPVIAGGM
jgi:mono/diheme cytochrome c family protein